jgi:hypothetical protein
MRDNPRSIGKQAPTACTKIAADSEFGDAGWEGFHLLPVATDNKRRWPWISRQIWGIAKAMNLALAILARRMTFGMSNLLCW